MTAATRQNFVVREVDSIPRIRWGTNGNKYQLNYLSRDGEDPRLPGKPKALDLKTFRQQDRTLIYGERSGGGRDFLSWLRGTLNKAKGEPWIFVQGDRWVPDLFQTSDPESDLKTEDSFLTSMLQEDSATAAGRIVRWAQMHEGPKLNLLIRDLGRLPDGAGLEAALALSKASDHAEVRKNIRLLLVDTSEESFQDTYDASGLSRLCWRFRLPWLSRDEVLRLAQHESYALAFDAEAIDEIMEVTGGQPLLVHSLLRELRGSAQSPGLPKIRRCFRRLRSTPPRAVERWREELTALTHKGRAFRNALGEYVSGARRSGNQSLPKPHVSLYYSGWIRFDDETENWKISSKLHAAFARAVLDEVPRS